MIPKLIIHGGAWNIPDEFVVAHLNGVQNAIQQIYPLLTKGLSALDAVEKTVNILEADPTYDAGRGAFLNEIGEIELDAFIMDGRDLNVGSVAAVQNLLHPVSLARKVMDETQHCLLVGKGAMKFAKKMGFQELPPEELLTERELIFFNKIKNDTNFRPELPFEFTAMDTVGAVAMDKNGNFAAATSTGGTARKMVGRVGDSPIVGAGGYADNELGAVSTTGWGESIMKVLLAKTVYDNFETHSAMDAAQQGIAILEKKVNGMGGVIGINHRGEYAFAHNTPRMAFAYADKDGEVISGIRIE
ncbi:MAG: beta-aspartyl-peptidase (threonine type) [Paraglaciecola sp.]|jgi:beta-aspartyl-peptidase (threonine type)